MKQIALKEKSALLTLAYLMAFPLRQAPDSGLVEFMIKLSKASGIDIQFVLSERLTGVNQTFEAYIRGTNDIGFIREFLTSYGWHPLESPRDPLILRCRKGNVQFVLMLVQSF